MHFDLGAGVTLRRAVNWNRARAVGRERRRSRVGSAPAARGADETTEFCADSLSPQVLSSGVPFLFVPMGTRAAVDRVVIDRAALLAWYKGRGLDELPVFVFSLEPGADGCTVYSRMFASIFGIPEDPGTGGASGPLAAYLLMKGAITPDRATNLTSLQGVKMGRPSAIHIRVRGSSDRSTRIEEVSVGGQAVIVGEGTIRVWMHRKTSVQRRDGAARRTGSVETVSRGDRGLI